MTQQKTNITKEHIGSRLLVKSYLIGDYKVSEVNVLELSSCGDFVKVKFISPGDHIAWDYANNFVILSVLEPEQVSPTPTHDVSVPWSQTVPDITPIPVVHTTHDEIIADALQDRWVSVRDRLPTTNGNYDVLTIGDRAVRSADYRDGRWNCLTTAVTAWYDTPAPTMNTLTRIDSRYNRVV